MAVIYTGIERREEDRLGGEMGGGRVTIQCM